MGWIRVIGSRFQQEHGSLPVFSQSTGQYTSGCSSANDRHVIFHGLFLRSHSAESKVRDGYRGALSAVATSAAHAILLREKAGDCPPRGVGTCQPRATGGRVASARRRVMRLTRGKFRGWGKVWRFLTLTDFDGARR